MGNNLWRFRSTLIPGLAVLVLLLGIVSALAYSLGSEFISSAERFYDIDSSIWHLLLFSIYQATLSTLFSLIIGLALAWSLNRQPKFWGRSVLVGIFSSSLVLPSLIVAFGIITVLGHHGWLNRLYEIATGEILGFSIYGLGGILTAHVYLNASFAAISMLKALESIPITQYRLSKSLALTPWQRFRYIEWTTLKSSIWPIASTIFLLCFSSFAIVLLLGGSPAYNTLEVAIYEAVRVDFDIPYALHLALIQLMISVILVVLASTARVDTSNIKQNIHTVPWRDLTHYHYLQIVIIAILALVYIFPLLAIVVDGMSADLLNIVTRDQFIRSLSTSFLIAAVSSLITVILSLVLADTMRQFANPVRISIQPLSHIATIVISLLGNLYLAIPTMIMGLGFFLIARDWGGDIEEWGMAAVITANVLMSLPFALSVMTPAMRKTSMRYDKLVISLGLGRLRQWRYADWPYIKSSIRYIAALSFTLSMGDLGIISLFGDDQFTTLPWYLYQLMGSYRTNDANGVALILMVIVMSVFMLASISKPQES